MPQPAGFALYHAEHVSPDESPVESSFTQYEPPISSSFQEPGVQESYYPDSNMKEA
jgi:hypothetical protein